jgi:hypothetical protein
MADLKISQLPAITSTTDADVLPLVQSGTTDKITVANLKTSINPTVPVKATGAELDTATDDAKFATALAIKNAHNVPSVAPGGSGNVLTSDGTDWTSAAPVVTATSTNTFTNKRITKRVTTISSHATPTVNTDDCDVVTITAQAEAITSMTTNLSGTPTNFQTLIFRILDNGTARAITWGAKFVAKGVALPTTTVLSKLLTVGFIYDTVTTTWGCVASSQEA